MEKLENRMIERPASIECFRSPVVHTAHTRTTALKRNILSDNLWLTDEEHPSFWFNKNEWKIITSSIISEISNRTIDLWKNSDGTTRNIHPSEEQIYRKYRNVILLKYGDIFVK